MNKGVLTVIGFEFFSFVRNKAYLILTVALTLIAFLGFFIPGFLGGSDPDQMPADNTPAGARPVLLVSGAEELDLFASLLPQFDLEATEPMADGALTQAFESNERLYGWLDLNAAGASIRVNRLEIDDAYAMTVHEAVRQYRSVSALESAGVNRTSALEQAGPFQFAVSELAADVGKSQSQTYMYTYIILMWLYMAVMIYGQVVAGNVAAEKGNRTMELLITSTKPINLLVGKVIGTALAGLLQIGLILSAALISYRLNRGDLSGLLGVAEITPSMIGYTLLFFLLGFFTYAFLFSALGSLVSRSEDVNKNVMTISMPLVIIFMVAMSALFVPTAGYVAMLSFVPFFSPFLMFVRTQMLVVPLWQVLISVVISLFTIVAVAFLSAKIYRLGTLFYGNQVKLKSLFRMLRY